MKMVFQIQGFRQKFLVWVMTLLLQVKFTQNFAVKQVIYWTKNKKSTPHLLLSALELQRPVALLTGKEICKSCGFIEVENDPHYICQMRLQIQELCDEALMIRFEEFEKSYTNLENATTQNLELFFIVIEIYDRPDLKNKIRSLP
jgi:hypothetical protein